MYKNTCDGIISLISNVTIMIHVGSIQTNYYMIHSPNPSSMKIVLDLLIELRVKSVFIVCVGTSTVTFLLWEIVGA
jgi:hypothetical protein